MEDSSNVLINLGKFPKLFPYCLNIFNTRIVENIETLV